MPVVIPDKLPAKAVLEAENVFVMTDSTALKQDIRALRIAILNLMPIKETTEVHLLRQLSNNPLQVEIDFVITETYKPKHTPETHLRSFYKTFSQIKSDVYDGLIITGAPVEQYDFEDVLYWEEIKQIMDWASSNVTSVLFICWAAQAGLYYHYNIPKYPLPKKMFGVFEHVVLCKNSNIAKGFDDVFLAPHSRHTEVRAEDILKHPDLQLVCKSDYAGVYLVTDEKRRRVFVTGHSEYDPLTLHEEYIRDLQKGLPIEKPINYYPNDDETQMPIVRWRSHANLLFSNWLNYYVYQQTPYQIQQIKTIQNK